MCAFLCNALTVLAKNRDPTLSGASVASTNSVSCLWRSCWFFQKHGFFASGKIFVYHPKNHKNTFFLFYTPSTTVPFYEFPIFVFMMILVRNVEWTERAECMFISRVAIFFCTATIFFFSFCTAFFLPKDALFGGMFSSHYFGLICPRSWRAKVRRCGTDTILPWPPPWVELSVFHISLPTTLIQSLCFDLCTVAFWFLMWYELGWQSTRLFSTMRSPDEPWLLCWRCARWFWLISAWDCCRTVFRSFWIASSLLSLPNDAVVPLLSLPDTVSELLLSVCTITIMSDTYHRAAAYVCCSIALLRSNVVAVQGS